MSYVDGFVMAIPTGNLTAYRKLARLAGKVWREHGALDYAEFVGDDLDSPMGRSFPKLTRTKEGETVIFAFIRYKSRAHRDKVNAKVMADPRLKGPDPENMPFDMKRMSHGGFKGLVET